MERRRDSLRDAGGAAALPGAHTHGDPAEGKEGACGADRPSGPPAGRGSLQRTFQGLLLLPILKMFILVRKAPDLI